jgi:DNA-binding NtrC family response regulator
MARNRLLVVEDEPGICLNIQKFLEVHGYSISEAKTCQKAVEIFQASQPDAVIADYMLPDGNGLDLLTRFKVINPNIPLIILTGHGSIDLAVKAIKEGAEHFLTKPVELPALLVILQRLLENQRNRQEQMVGKSRLARLSIDPFIGINSAIRQIEKKVKLLLPSESTILIRGETGTGKGVLAKWLHYHSPRREEPFVDLNCAGLSRELLESELFGHEKGAYTGANMSKAGLFEIAHRGAVFLDEIGDMDLQVQAKLLKVLEEKKFRRLGDIRERVVDIRLIAATHQNLNLLVQEKKFRSDLYYRINAMPITLPPLRERSEDIPFLARYLLKELASELGRGEVTTSPELDELLQHYEWPGNIRELRNVLERAILLAGHSTLGPEDLHLDSTARTSPPHADPIPTLLEVERRHIEEMLRLEGGRVEQTAMRLGLSRSALYEKIKKHGIDLSRIQE